MPKKILIELNDYEGQQLHAVLVTHPHKSEMKPTQFARSIVRDYIKAELSGPNKELIEKHLKVLKKSK